MAAAVAEAAATAGAGRSVRALAAPMVLLLAKHEQKPPSTEQPFSECRGGEKQGDIYTFYCQFYFFCV